METNREFKTTFVDWTKKTNFFVDLSPIDMENPAELKAKTIEIFDSKKSKIGRFNQKMFNSLFFARFLLSDSTIH